MDATTAAFLISKGAEVRVLSPTYPDFNTTTNRTLLHTAAFRGLRDLVDVLLKAGASADINTAYYDTILNISMTPLMSASWGCYTHYDSPWTNISINGTIKLLLESGADPLPFGPTGTLPTYVMIKIPNQELRKCGEVVGACPDADEVKKLVQEWKEANSARTCPDSWLRLWEAQEQAAAKGGGGGGDNGAENRPAAAQTGRKLLGCSGRA
jgi:hypothetical protein